MAEATGVVEEEAGGSEPGVGHNQPEVVWERWVKKRTFVRALEGTYGEMQAGLYEQKRVYSTADMEWKGGPQAYGKHIINPKDTQVAQSIETHMHVFAPGGYAQNHGHMNTATFYVLRGQGYDIHDGEKIPFEAGDMLLVESACVHQHFNSSNTEDLAVVVMKAKPLFLFMHMLFQKTVKMPPSEPVPGMDLYTPPTDAW
jgi:quercetin dioxygenase-like cupin family protein